MKNKENEIIFSSKSILIVNSNARFDLSSIYVWTMSYMSGWIVVTENRFRKRLWKIFL